MTSFEKRRARISGGELAYVDEGTGRPVLFLHGFPTHGYLWREYLPAFPPWFRVLVPDLLGHGDSGATEDAPLDLGAQAGYVRELLEALGVERCAVVGHAHGGGVAQRLALEGRAEALILIDSVVSGRRPAGPIDGLRTLAPDAERMAEARALCTDALRLGMGRPERLADGDLEEYLRPFSGPEGARACVRAARGWDGRGLEDAAEGLGRLDIPTLIVWGEDDPFLAVSVGEELSEAIPSSTFAVLPGCSHFVTEDARETLVPLLHEYLRSQYLKEGHAHPQTAGAVPVRLERAPPR